MLFNNSCGIKIYKNKYSIGKQMNPENTIDKYSKPLNKDSSRFNNLVVEVDFLPFEQKSYLIQHLLEAEIFTVVLNQTYLINIDTAVENISDQLSCLPSDYVSKLLEAIAILMRQN
jgi:hypothetical protein